MKNPKNMIHEMPMPIGRTNFSTALFKFSFRKLTKIIPRMMKRKANPTICLKTGILNLTEMIITISKYIKIAFLFSIYFFKG
jgi:hypothetical protein